MPSCHVSPRPMRAACSSAQTGVPGRPERDIEGAARVPAVVVGAGRGAVGECLGGDEVAPADLRGIDPELGRQHVQGALQQERCLRPARSPVGAHRGGGGHDRDRVEIDPGDPVRARGHEAGQRGQGRGLAGVRADVLDHEDPEPAYPPVPGGAQLDVLHLPAAVRHRDHVLGSRLRPADRASQVAGEPGDHDVLGVRRDLPAEPAAHRRGADAHLGRVQPQHLGDDAAGVVGRLHRGPQRHRWLAGGRAGDGESAIGLHRHRRHPLVDEPCPHGDLGALERAAIGGHIVDADREVGAVGLEQDRRVGLQRRLGIDHRGERLVVDGDGVGGVHGLRPGLRHHHRHRLADETDPADGEQRPGEHLGTVFDRGHAQPAHVPGGEHAGDTRHRAGVVRIDRPDERVCHRGPDEHPVQRPLAGDIVQVPGRPGEQRAILAAEHGAAQDLPERGLLQQVRSVGGHACRQLDPRMPSGISSPWASIRSSHMAITCWVVSVAAVFGSSSAAW